MLNRSWFARPLCLLACAMMSFPAVAAEAIPSPTAKRQVVDVKLNENGAVLGKLVDRQGKPLANVTVNVASKDSVVATKTNNDGFFAAKGMKSGQLALQVANHTQMIRVWNADVAPPSAAPGAMLVVGDAVRGQCCPQECAPACGGCGGCNQCGGGGGIGGLFGGGGGAGLLASPLVIGAGVAAAIAIPLALDDDDAS